MIRGIMIFVMTAVLDVMAIPDARFYGGAYDGGVVAFLRQYDRDSSPQWVSGRFTGGGYDGYTRADYIQYDRDTSPQWESARFHGGVRDGYSHGSYFQYDRATSPQWVSARFVGGSYDGADLGIVAGIANPLSGDLDSDGLPDWWEALYYASIYTTDAMGDTDFDGMSAWAEYVSGTVPTNNASRFQCLEIATTESSNGWKIIRWSSEADRTYSIAAVTDLRKNESTPLVSNLPATPPGNVWTNTTTNAPFEVYKVEVSW